MIDVYLEAVRLLERGEPLAIATVVRTRGSTPQRAGSKLLVRQDGSSVGTLGGGCVEADLWDAASRALAGVGEAERRSYALTEPIGSPHGMVCGGGMDFLVEPIRRSEPFLALARLVVAAYGGGPAVAVATMTGPQECLGRRLLVGEAGAREGSLGRAEWDAAAAEAARDLLAEGGFRSLRLPGDAEVFLEAYAPPPAIAAVGGGHIGKALEAFAKRLGFLFFVTDDRPAFATTDRFLEADAVLVADIAEGLAQLPLRSSSSIVVATRGHKLDDVALEAALGTPASYIGLVSSRRKWLLIRESLLARGLPADRLDAVHAPVGLDVGAVTPDEIALSILAEILAVRRGRSGGPMSGSRAAGTTPRAARPG